MRTLHYSKKGGKATYDIRNNLNGKNNGSCGMVLVSLQGTFTT